MGVLQLVYRLMASLRLVFQLMGSFPLMPPQWERCILEGCSIRNSHDAMPNQQQDRTIVLVLHDLNQACRYTDHLVVVNDGTIYDQGHPEKVMTKKMVWDVFGLGSRIVRDPVAGMPLCIPVGRKVSVRALSNQYDW